MQNIQLVDFVRLGAPEAPAQRFLFNLIEQRQTTLLAEFLESFRPTIGFAGSRITAAVTTAPTGATPDLIDAGNQMGMRIDELHHCFANSSTASAACSSALQRIC